MKLRKPNTKDIEKAILRGAKMVDDRKIDGKLFNLDDDGKLCACALGAAAIGAGMLSMKEIKKLLNEDDFDGIFPFDEEDIVAYFPNGIANIPMQLFTDENSDDDKDKELASLTRAHELNDDTHMKLSEIAEAMGILQRVSLAIQGKLRL